MLAKTTHPSGVVERRVRPLVAERQHVGAILPLDLGAMCGVERLAHVVFPLVCN